MSKIVSFAGLIATLVIAYVCDRWVEHLGVEATRTFTMGPYLWLSGLTNLLLAIIVVLLIWYVLQRAAKSILVSTLFTLIGLAYAFSAAIDLSLPSPLLVLAGMLGLFPTGSHMLFASAFLAVIGIASFILPRRASL